MGKDESKEPRAVPRNRQPQAVKLTRTGKPAAPRKQKVALALAIAVPACLTLLSFQLWASQGISPLAVAVALAVGFGSLVGFVTVTNWWLRRHGVKEFKASPTPAKPFLKRVQVVGFVLIILAIILAIAGPSLTAHITDPTPVEETPSVPPNTAVDIIPRPSDLPTE